MDHADDDAGNNDVFIYMGGDQQVPEDVTHIRVHKSVKIIPRYAFNHCTNLVTIEMHDGVEIIEECAFYWCYSLKGIKLTGVRVIGNLAFAGCTELVDVFGDKLETIGMAAFSGCTALRNVRLPKVRTIGNNAFTACWQLTDVELSKDIETVGEEAFEDCPRLRRIAMPLKGNMFDRDNVFDGCDDLSQVDLVGGIHKTISSLLLDSWRNEMNDEIDRINQVLPNTPTMGADNKTVAIRRWIGRVRDRIEHYKSEHYALLKNNMTQLELALWGTNLLSIDAASRVEARITCGASIIIPHVLSFLNDNDEFPLVECNH